MSKLFIMTAVILWPAVTLGGGQADAAGGERGRRRAARPPAVVTGPEFTYHHSRG